MNKLINLGAINKVSSQYELPLFADKKNEYKCPDCDKKVMLKKGKIKDHISHTTVRKTKISVIFMNILEKVKYINTPKKC